MIKNYNGSIRTNYPTSLDLSSIEAYLKGAINHYIKTNGNSWFKAKDLIFSNWNDTPLQQIYDFFESNGLTENDSQKKAGMMLGHILKKVVYEDERLFEIKKEDVSGENYKVTKYKLVI